VYLREMKNTFPNLIIGVNILLNRIIDYNNQPHNYDCKYLLLNNWLFEIKGDSYTVKYIKIYGC